MNKNEKNPDWEVPVKLPSVRPEAYPKKLRSTGLAHKRGKKKSNSGPPDYTLPGHPNS